MNKNKKWLRTNEEMALMLRFRPARTPAGKAIAEVVIARLEARMAEHEAFKRAMTVWIAQELA